MLWYTPQVRLEVRVACYAWHIGGEDQEYNAFLVLEAISRGHFGMSFLEIISADHFGVLEARVTFPHIMAIEHHIRELLRRLSVRHCLTLHAAHLSLATSRF
jgi:hypothetical protein